MGIFVEFHGLGLVVLKLPIRIGIIEDHGGVGTVIDGSAALDLRRSLEGIPAYPLIEHDTDAAIDALLELKLIRGPPLTVNEGGKRLLHVGIKLLIGSSNFAGVHRDLAIQFLGFDRYVPWESHEAYDHSQPQQGSKLIHHGFGELAFGHGW